MPQIQLSEGIKLKNQLITLHQHMKEADDDVNANKIIDLFEKVSKREHIVGFTGHFSAGKSSIINYMLETNVLPKSPIPTSANIVKITSGKGLVHVYFKDKTIYEYNEPYDIDVIQDYCQDKDTIEQVSIQLSNTVLPDSVALLDTPGIDAADDTDRFITESALHMIDTLYYVMDYHHVQSEVNLQFLQQMHKNNIPIYIIINQIDKHHDQELSFLDFKCLIENTCEQWGIHPEKIYYTSTIATESPYNEIDLFKSEFFQIISNEDYRGSRTKTAMNRLITAHEQVLKDTYAKEMVELEDDEANDEQLNKVNQQLKLWEGRIDEFKRAFMSEVNFTLNNAYLMPATLRELAQDYLEAMQRDFKVGFLASKKKTNKEKTARTNAFLEKLKQTMESTVQWKLREKLLELLQQYDLNNDSFAEQAQHIIVHYTASDLLHFTSQGATINGNYILNYTNNISSDIKSQYRKQTINLLQKIELYYGQIVSEKITTLQSEQKWLSKVDELRTINVSIQQALTNKINLLHSELENSEHSEETHQQFAETIAISYDIKKQRSMIPLDKNTRQQQLETVETTERETFYEPNLVLKAIERTIAELEQIDGFQHFIVSLQQQKDILMNRDVTIALFGAFSAGKSSFSNALLGEQILPASPNPTTAVINRITAPTGAHLHGTVKITFKDAQTILQDVIMVTNIKVAENESFIKLASRAIEEDKEIDDMYRAFLLAIKQGYDSIKDSIGLTMTIPFEQFPAFVTDESKACFIETVDLYYECGFTRKGLTIVDTPGADSVNARHTNVAFDYIKYADIIFYVTYYNHAITRADRDFLIQLGRVKEAFALDKMFFIVNAADLAHTESDLELVVNYVKDQLLSLGIRQAHVFPVSSKLSLIEKQQQTPLNIAMAKFEQTLNQFVEEGLTQLTMQTAIWELHRISTNLKQRIHAASLNETERKSYFSQLNQERNEGQLIIKKETGSLLQERLNERIERQLHYVLERLYIRFHDIFSDYFNPTTVTESGRLAQHQLRMNGKKLINYVGYELLQEIRAVSLRIEAHLNELLKLKQEDFKKALNDVTPTFMLASFQPYELDTPEYEQAFNTLDISYFTQSLKVFKNKKSFFEQNDREKMKELFYEQLQPLAEDYLDKNKVMMKSAYADQMQSSLEIMKQQMIKELNQLINEQQHAMSTDVDIKMLENINDKIEIIVQDSQMETDFIKI